MSSNTLPPISTTVPAISTARETPAHGAARVSLKPNRPT
jgi:hypothetical protein